MFSCMLRLRLAAAVLFVSLRLALPADHPRDHKELQADLSNSPEADALLRARSWQLKSFRPLHLADYNQEAWDTLLHARKYGPHRVAEVESQTFAMQSLHHSRLATMPGHQLRRGERMLIEGLLSAEWCFLGILLSLLFGMDALLLQSLPEMQRSHISVLGFWLFVGIACALEIWICAGPEAGTSWLSGYIMELVSSADNIFIMQLIFSSLDTPHRLMTKALFANLIGCIGIRLGLFLGLAQILAPAARVVAWLLGTGLVYAGVSRMSIGSAKLDDFPDVTESGILRALRRLMGSRLGEFYDEDGELVLIEEKGRYRMTLLGVVLLCLFSVHALLGLDVVLAKMETSPNIYLNFSSSAIALFAVRALFFVARDYFNECCLTRHAAAGVVLLIGIEMLVGHSVYVNSLLSLTLFGCITACSVAFSSMRSPWSKMEDL